MITFHKVQNRPVVVFLRRVLTKVKGELRFLGLAASCQTDPRSPVIIAGMFALFVSQEFLCVVFHSF